MYVEKMLYICSNASETKLTDPDTSDASEAKLKEP